jgi:hypothetical protein
MNRDTLKIHQLKKLTPQGMISHDSSTESTCALKNRFRLSLTMLHCNLARRSLLAVAFPLFRGGLPGWIEKPVPFGRGFLKRDMQTLIAPTVYEQCPRRPSFVIVCPAPLETN